MKKNLTWVVYERLIKGLPSGSNSVCDQDEWDEMERQRPGENTLIKSAISNEGEAERFARERSDIAGAGKTPVKPPRRIVVAPIMASEVVVESVTSPV